MTLCSWAVGPACDTPESLRYNEKTQNPGMKMVLPQINFIRGSASTMSVTYASVLPVRDETVDFLAVLLSAERLRRGTRARTRSLSWHDQAVLVLRSFPYDYLHEGIDVLAAQAPSLHGALLADRRIRGLDWLLDWLTDQPGETWQQRWMVSGADDLGGRLAAGADRPAAGARAGVAMAVA